MIDNKKFNFNLIFSYAQFFVTSIFPIFVMIHASNVLSVSVWGEILLLQSFSLFSSILIVFGTEVYGLREISKAISNESKISKIINQVFFLRLINFFIFFSISFLIVSIIKIPIYLFLIILVWTFPLIISPLWIYTALGKLNSFFYIELFIKTIAILIIYLNVLGDTDNDLLILTLIGVHYFISIASLINIRKNICFNNNPISFLKETYIETTPFFLIQFCANIFTTFPILIVGYTLGSTQAAIFGNAERLFRMFRSLYSPINRIVLKFSSSQEIDNKVKLKEFLFAGFFGILVFLLGAIFISFFIEKILGEKYIDSISIALILISVIPFIFAGNQILHSYIYPSNNELFFMKTLLWLTPLNIISLFSLSYFIGLHGTALSMFIAELALFIIFFSFIKTKFRNT